MVAAVRVHKHGGPEALTYEEVEVPTPGPGQARVKNRACGLNFIDTYFRSGLYPSPTGMPFVAGNEGAGEVVAVGPGVTEVKVGDPVGSKDKAELAKANGCHHTILYRDEDFVAKVKEITGGKLCEVVYDGVGKATFPKSLDCIKPLGMFASFGNASGSIESFNINLLQQKGSLFCTRPTLNTYAAKREDLVAIAKNLFDAVFSGKVKIPINQKYALKDAQQAHRDLEARKTTGSTVLMP